MKIRSLYIFLFFLCGYIVVAKTQILPGHFTSGRDVRLRTEPLVNGQVIGLMEIGTAVFVLEKTEQKSIVGKDTNFWYKINLDPKFVLLDSAYKKTGVTGWVFGKFISTGKFDINTLTRQLKYTGARPLAFKLMSKYNWTELGWDEFPDYQYNGELTLHDSWMVDGRFYYESRYYEILKIDSIAFSSFNVEVRFLGDAGISDDTHSWFKVPFPTQNEIFTFSVYHNLDSLNLFHAPFPLPYPEYYEPNVTLHNTSKPACYKVKVNDTALRLAARDAGAENEHDHSKDSIIDTVGVGEFLFNTELIGFVSHYKYESSGVSDYWYRLHKLDDRRKAFWVCKTNLSDKVNFLEMIQYLNRNLEPYQEIKDFAGSVYTQEGAGGKRKLTFGLNTMTILEPDGSLRMQILFDDIPLVQSEGVLYFSSADRAYSIFWDPLRGNKPYSDLTENEILIYDIENKNFISRFYDNGPINFTSEKVWNPEP